MEYTRIMCSDKLHDSLQAKATLNKLAITLTAVFDEGLIIFPVFNLIGNVIRKVIRNLIGNT
jgi:hypothetical protein